MLRNTLALLFVFSLAIGCQGQGPAYYASKQASLKPLLEVLEKAGISGSLEFSGTCSSVNGPDFPEFDATAPNAASALEAVRAMFARNPTMQVTQEADETIRMIQRGVPTDFLNVKIAHIPFETGRPPTHHPIYSADAALVHIWVAPEVTRFLKDRNIPEPAFLATGALPPSAPPPNMPYLSGAPLDNVTVSLALDQILKVFPGIWYYEDCQPTDSRNRIIRLGFYHLQNVGGGERIVQ